MQKRINVLLDLDHTLICSLTKDEEPVSLKTQMKKFRWENMEDIYKVFERPGLQDFLNFLFENFNVSIWTAASKAYALFIIEEFILKNNKHRKIDYVFFSYHCKKSKKLKKTQKSLHMLKDVFKLDNFEMDRTFIIDDHPEVYSSQPNNCFHIEAFEMDRDKAWKDNGLSVIRKKLEKLLDD